MVKRPHIIIQARMNSERLPGKVMMCAGGQPLIGILIKRIKNAGIPIILATSKCPSNDRLVEYVNSLGVIVFRNSEDNVLERYYMAAKSVNADFALRITGDNPFVESSIIKEVLLIYIKTKKPRVYISTGLGKTWPLGISVEGFSYELLEEAYQNASQPGEYEHVTPYMHQNMPGNIEIVKYNLDKNRYQYRLTVDTEEDFKLFKTLVEKHQAGEKTISEIIKILDNNPELVKINSNSAQKQWQ